MSAAAMQTMVDSMTRGDASSATITGDAAAALAALRSVIAETEHRVQSLQRRSLEARLHRRERSLFGDFLRGEGDRDASREAARLSAFIANCRIVAAQLEILIGQA